MAGDRILVNHSKSEYIHIDISGYRSIDVVKLIVSILRNQQFGWTVNDKIEDDRLWSVPDEYNCVDYINSELHSSNNLCGI